MKKGIVYRCSGGPLRYQGWPSVDKDENGVLYAVWSGGRAAHICPFGVNYMVKSRDGGETWSCPTIINDTFLDDRDTGITCLGDGKMIMSFFNLSTDYYRNCRSWVKNHSGKLAYDLINLVVEEVYPSYTEEQNNWGSFVKITKDGGETWTDPIKVPVTAPHGPIYTKGGRLLYLGKENNSGETEFPGQIMLYESFDGGYTWERLSVLPTLADKENQIHEPHVAELPDGTLFAAVRYHDPNTSYGAFTIYFTRSTDGGKTWETPVHMGKNGSPPHLLVLQDGRLLLTYGRRCQPYGIVAQISDDGGRTWGNELYLSEEATADIGYPATTQLPDGRLFTLYYQRYENDAETSILSTTWSADEIQ